MDRMRRPWPRFTSNKVAITIGYIGVVRRLHCARDNPDGSSTPRYLRPPPPPPPLRPSSRDNALLRLPPRPPRSPLQVFTPEFTALSPGNRTGYKRGSFLVDSSRGILLEETFVKRRSSNSNFLSIVTITRIAAV